MTDRVKWYIGTGAGTCEILAPKVFHEDCKRNVIEQARAYHDDDKGDVCDDTRNGADFKSLTRRDDNVLCCS